MRGLSNWVFLYFEQLIRAAKLHGVKDASGIFLLENQDVQVLSEPSLGQIVPLSARIVKSGCRVLVTSGMSNKKVRSPPLIHRYFVRNCTPFVESFVSQALSKGEAFIVFVNTCFVDPKKVYLPSLCADA